LAHKNKNVRKKSTPQLPILSPNYGAVHMTMPVQKANKHIPQFGGALRAHFHVKCPL